MRSYETGYVFTKWTQKSLIDSFCIQYLLAYPNLGKLDEPTMLKITFSLPDSHIDALDSMASQAQCSRAEIIRRAIGQHIEGFEDLSVAEKRLQDPNDPVLPWGKAKHGFLK